MFRFKVFRGVILRKNHKFGLPWMETHSSQKTDSSLTPSDTNTPKTECSHSSNTSQPNTKTSSTFEMLERTWKFGDNQLFRAEKLYTAKNYQTFIEAFRKNFPNHLFFDPTRSKELITAPYDQSSKSSSQKTALFGCRTSQNPTTSKKPHSNSSTSSPTNQALTSPTSASTAQSPSTCTHQNQTSTSSFTAHENFRQVEDAIQNSSTKTNSPTLQATVSKRHANFKGDTKEKSSCTTQPKNPAKSPPNTATTPTCPLNQSLHRDHYR